MASLTSDSNNSQSPVTKEDSTVTDGSDTELDATNQMESSSNRASSITLVTTADGTGSSSEETEGPDTVSIVSGSSETGGPDSRPVSR